VIHPIHPIEGARTISDQAHPSDQLTLGPLEELVGYHLRKAFGAFVSDFSRAMDGTDMRQVLFGILSVISANPGINQSNVGKLLGIQRANMVAFVNELVDRGLVLRKTAAGDRRALALQLTPAGAASVEQTLARIRRHEDRMLAGFSRGERILLGELLARIEAMGD
jgi:DNA-binding MarR family transcriptional regulator